MAKLSPVNPVCIQIGRQLKLARKYKKITLKRLADELGISYQQLQKYEKGLNRISAEKLWRISQILDVPIWDFFVGLEGEPEISIECLKAAQEMFRLAKGVDTKLLL